MGKTGNKLHKNVKGVRKFCIFHVFPLMFHNQWRVGSEKQQIHVLWPNEFLYWRVVHVLYCVVAYLWMCSSITTVTISSTCFYHISFIKDNR